jgi:hypothetical protein
MATANATFTIAQELPLPMTTYVHADPTEIVGAVCGAAHFQGRFRMYHELSSASSPHSLPRWGHASTTDFVRWTHHGPALGIDPAGPGCVVPHGGALYAFFPGTVGVGGDVLAARSVDGCSFEPLGPVGLEAEGAEGAEEDDGERRGPYVFLCGGRYHMLLPGRGGGIDVYAGGGHPTDQPYAHAGRLVAQPTSAAHRLTRPFIVPIADRDGHSSAAEDLDGGDAGDGSWLVGASAEDAGAFYWVVSRGAGGRAWEAHHGPMPMLPKTPHFGVPTATWASVHNPAIVWGSLRGTATIVGASM